MAEYAAWPICPSKAATLAVEIITPRSPVGSGGFFAIASAARRIMLKLPIRLMPITRAKRSSGCAPSLPTVLAAGPMPAQLTSPISLPIDCALATTALASASCVTSQRTKAALPPNSLASASPLSACTSAMTTLPPSRTNMRALPSPRPEAPPVTMNTLPVMSMVIDVLVGFSP